MKIHGIAPTPFESKVYDAVKRIPEGRVRSYGWVAKKIGRPGTYRAVGNALNKNPYPIIVPCHRVVRSDGSLGGFSKGPKAKMKLLKAEGLTPRAIRDIIKTKERPKFTVRTVSRETAGNCPHRMLITKLRNDRKSRLQKN